MKKTLSRMLIKVMNCLEV